MQSQSLQKKIITLKNSWLTAAYAPETWSKYPKLQRQCRHFHDDSLAMMKVKTKRCPRKIGM